MVAKTAQVSQIGTSIDEIAQAIAEITGSDSASILNQMATNPTHDLAIPSPQAMAVLGKLRAKYSFSVTRQDISKTKRGSYCSIKLLADLVDKKAKQSSI